MRQTLRYGDLSVLYAVTALLSVSVNLCVSFVFLIAIPFCIMHPRLLLQKAFMTDHLS